MSPLPRVATVHEKTVQRAQEIVDQPIAKVHSLRTGHQRRTATHYVKVDPRVWKTALRLAKGDPNRLTVVHETEVIVHNHPRKGHRRG